jgi:predicted dehydrogenase
MATAGEFGDIFYMEGDYIHQILHKLTDGWRGRMDVYSVFYGGGIHLIDLMRWIVADEVTEVMAMGTNKLTESSAYRYDDTVVGLLRFARGTLAKSLTTLGPQRTQFHALDIYGTAKTFINDMPDAKIFSGDRAEDEAAITDPYPAMEKGDLLAAFVAAVRDGGQPEVTAVDVFRVMDVCFALVESLSTGRAVKVDYQV